MISVLTSPGVTRTNKTSLPLVTVTWHNTNRSIARRPSNTTMLDATNENLTHQSASPPLVVNTAAAATNKHNNKHGLNGLKETVNGCVVTLPVPFTRTCSTLLAGEWRVGAVLAEGGFGLIARATYVGVAPCEHREAAVKVGATRCPPKLHLLAD